MDGYYRKENNFVDDEGTKLVKRMILYSAITGHFIRQKRCQSTNAETCLFIQMVNIWKH